MPDALGRILIVDDSKTIKSIAKSMLQANFEIMGADDGYSALKTVQDFRPDIIFVDVMMPRCDGYTFCSTVKNNFSYAATPVLMLTSKNSVLDKARAKLAQSDGYLIKPFSKPTLYEALARFIKIPQSILNEAIASK